MFICKLNNLHVSNYELQYSLLLLYNSSVSKGVKFLVLWRFSQHLPCAHIVIQKCLSSNEHDISSHTHFLYIVFFSSSLMSSIHKSVVNLPFEHEQQIIVKCTIHNFLTWYNNYIIWFITNHLWATRCKSVLYIRVNYRALYCDQSILRFIIDNWFFWYHLSGTIQVSWVCRPD